MIKAEILNMILRDEERLDAMLDTDTRQWLADTLVSFTTRAIPKFLKGHKEHGGSIFDRDLQLELENEHIDSLMYMSAMRRKADLSAIQDMK